MSFWNCLAQMWPIFPRNQNIKRRGECVQGWGIKYSWDKLFNGIVCMLLYSPCLTSCCIGIGNTNNKRKQRGLLLWVNEKEKLSIIFHRTRVSCKWPSSDITFEERKMKNTISVAAVILHTMQNTIGRCRFYDIFITTVFV